VLFHFELRCNGRWEAIGSGEAEGKDACLAALADLNALAGGSLPSGSYRCIAATSAATRWEALRLGAEGEIGFEEEDASRRVGLPAGG
jgi:hypothetical protein